MPPAIQAEFDVRMSSSPAGAYDPCIDGEVSDYFNRPDVQKAFHANSSGNQLPWTWESCSSKVLYSRLAPACSQFIPLAKSAAFIRYVINSSMLWPVLVLKPQDRLLQMDTCQELYSNSCMAT